MSIDLSIKDRAAKPPEEGFSSVEIIDPTTRLTVPPQVRRYSSKSWRGRTRPPRITVVVTAKVEVVGQ